MLAYSSLQLNLRLQVPRNQDELFNPDVLNRLNAVHKYNIIPHALEFRSILFKFETFKTIQRFLYVLSNVRTHFN